MIDDQDNLIALSGILSFGRKSAFCGMKLLGDFETAFGMVAVTETCCDFNRNMTRKTMRQIHALAHAGSGT